jgi:DNA-binding LacI/PurR family transcriptional regulator
MIRTVTMKDIAQECEVSLSTVSLVLSNSPRISESTRKQVLAACERLGYQPNTHARNLALRAPGKNLSVVVPDMEHVFSDLYVGEILSGIYACSSEHGYQASVCLANSRFLRKRDHINLIKSRRADGMLFVASSLYDQYLLDFDKQNLPVVLVNNMFSDAKLNFVAADYKSAGKQAADHLIELGHTHIGLIMGTNIQTQHDFLDACSEAFKKAGIPEGQTPWADGRFSEQGGFNGARQLLKDHPETTAFLATSDKMAAGALSFLNESGISVPGDISLVGTDNIPLSNYFAPPLTTVDLHLHDVGYKACERVLSLVNEEIESCEEFHPVDLIVRKSTGPAPKKG